MIEGGQQGLSGMKFFILQDLPTEPKNPRSMGGIMARAGDAQAFTPDKLTKSMIKEGGARLKAAVFQNLPSLSQELVETRIKTTYSPVRIRAVACAI